jgi:hypothetical protein
MTTYRQTFRVTGMGEFPLDMLRYDHCWPATETDAASAEGPRHCPRTVAIVRDIRQKGDVPTASRWHSFGWDVDTASIDTFRA